MLRSRALGLLRGSLPTPTALCDQRPNAVRWASQRAFQGSRDRFRRQPPRPAKTETRDGEAVPAVCGELLYGIHSVSQALASGHRRVHALYVRDGVGSTTAVKADLAALSKIQSLATDRAIEISPISKWMLNHITDDKPHQGVVLDVDPVKLPDFDVHTLDEIVSSSVRPVILALDELHDTQNLGAILRSAHFLGCSAVILSERNSAPVSPAASRASAGALEVLLANVRVHCSPLCLVLLSLIENKLVRAKNLHQALAIGREKGWRVIGACSGPNSITSNQLSSDQPIILVMGNEHKGLRKGIRQCCDDIVTIPGNASEEDSRVDSLNVSVAAAILLYEVLHH